METRENYKHSLRLAVRWGDADALGHINNVQYVRYIESSRVDYSKIVNDLNFDTNAKECWILADLQCSYLGQLHYPCEIDVCTRVSKIGNKSAEIIATVFVANKPDPVFTSRAVIVWFDYITQQSRRIPDSVRKQIMEFETLKPDI
jgi:acyl-CoA thioester hydrolase